MPQINKLENKLESVLKKDKDLQIIETPHNDPVVEIHYDKNPYVVITETQDSVRRIEQSVDQLQQVTREILHTIKTKRRDKQNTLPLRQPANNDVYFYLMSLQREFKEKNLQYSRFRVAVTLLWAAGLRVNEIRNITQDDIDSIIHHKSLQVYQPKTNKYRLILFTKQSCDQFRALENECTIVFNKYSTLSGGIAENSWIYFINSRLLEKTRHLGLNIKSHSFRVNFVTSLLKHAPLQIVSNLIGHTNISTTVKYDRYYPNKDETLNLLEKAFTTRK
ncbi:hypothetical protein ACKKBG_M90135 (mitochondrion) [Auxenochlorella protothecoides x Auxenochlorella symbiontica]|uniref:Integrase recombinase n=1 Tax=Auxenochlorella protothecoides TaxID=3075 RepID=A0A0A6ZEJ2_AUXPR|nr:putative integrase/recombinase protein [Auxenochlorella protothecoides]AGN72430.1 putative integrase/recombinase protein [Auxenochlorella protothecoides]ARV87641.1 integrase recombinase [Auxenochlorella protothecoides]